MQEGKKTFEKDLRPLIMALLAQEKIKYAKKQTAASRSFQDRLTWIENATDTKQYIASAMKVLEEELKRQDQRNSNRSNEPPLTVDTQIATDTTTTPSPTTVETQQSELDTTTTPVQPQLKYSKVFAREVCVISVERTVLARAQLWLLFLVFVDA